MIPAVLGAFILYGEAQEIISDQIQGNRQEAQIIANDMATVIYKIFLKYNSLGIASDFFSLIPMPIDNNIPLESSILPPDLVFKALKEGAVLCNQQIEKPVSSEMSQNSFYIATVGRNNSGKGIVTSYLHEKYGFTAYPLSDRVREMAAALGNIPPLDRDILIETGRKVKDIFGDSVLIKSAIKLFYRLNKENRLLFDGLRVDGEANGLLKMTTNTQEVIIIKISAGLEEEADLKERFRRAITRGGPKDPKNDSDREFEKFKKLDNKEKAGIIAAMEKATHQVINNNGINEIHTQIDKIMKDLNISPININED